MSAALSVAVGVGEDGLCRAMKLKNLPLFPFSLDVLACSTLWFPVRECLAASAPSLLRKRWSLYWLTLWDMFRDFLFALLYR